MLFYHFEMLDDFIKSDLIYNLKEEIEEIEQLINLYNNKKINLLAITTNMIKISNSLDKSKLEYFYDTVSSLKQCFEKVNEIQELADKLKEELMATISLYDKGIDNNSDEIKANLVEYNKQRDELSHRILDFESVNTTIINSAIRLSLTSSNKKIEKQNAIVNTIIKKDTTKKDIELEPEDNNVLIISEKEQKAYLPFLYSEVKKIYENSHHQYQTLQDVVDDLYVIPLSKFKNSTLARFNESFHLIHDKEKGSTSKALDLALELMFKHELNPIIIAACRNLDELDIYLDCLEENELENFTCFEIKFEVMPQVIQKEKNAFLF